MTDDLYEVAWDGAKDRLGTCFSIVTYTGSSSLAEAMNTRPRIRGLSNLLPKDRNRAAAKARQRGFNPTYTPQTSRERWRAMKKMALVKLREFRA